MFHLHRSSDNQFYFTLRARNGRVLMTSETYKSKQGMGKAITSIENMFENLLEKVDHTDKPVKRASISSNGKILFTTERMVGGKLKVVRVGK